MPVFDETNDEMMLRRAFAVARAARTEVLADALGDRLAACYARAFSGREPCYTEMIAEAARL